MVEHKLGVSIVGEDKASGPIRNVQSALVNLDKSAKTSAGGFNTLGAAAAAAAGFIVAEIGGKAVSAVSDLTKEMVKLGLEQDRLATRSKNLYKNLGLEKYQKEIAKTIEQQSIMTGMDDEELLSSYNKLLAVTKDRTQATKLLALAQDMAAGSGETLEASTTSITNALMGQTRGLKQFGIDIEEDTFKATTFAGQIRMLEQEINKLYAGAAGEAGKSPAGIFAGFETAIENVKEMFGEELIESLAPTLKSITDIINELATSGKLDPLIESFGNLAQKVVEMGPEIWDLTKAILGVANDEEAILAIADAFDRVGYFVGELNKLLDKTAYYIDKLDLDKVAAFIGAGTPVGTLWNWGGAGVEAQSNTTSSGNPTKKNTEATKKNTEAKEDEKDSQEKLSEENMSAAEKLKLMKGTTQEVTAVTGAFGNAMGSAIGTIGSAMSYLGGGGYSSGGGEGCGGGGCRTYATGTVRSGSGNLVGGGGGASGSPGMLWYNRLGNENAGVVAAMGEKWANTISSVTRSKCSGLVCNFTTSENTTIGGAPATVKGTYFNNGSGSFTQTKREVIMNDALITKRGDIVKFHPDDNILAYKGNGPKGNISVNITVNGSGDPDRVAELIMKKIEKIQRMS